jgi:hypothetical protein
VGDPTGQVHDFEPGITASGLFWTTRVHDAAADVRPGRGRASLSARMRLPDFHDILNALSPSPTSVPGHARFDVQWRADGPLTRIHDDTFGFSGRYVPSSATIRFAVSDDGSDVVYRSDDTAQVTVAGGVGSERNGVFFDAHEPPGAGAAPRLDARSRWAAVR